MKLVSCALREGIYKRFRLPKEEIGQNTQGWEFPSTIHFNTEFQ